jgi:putative transposase
LIGTVNGGRSRLTVSDAKRLKELETENARLKRLLAEAMLETKVTKEALRKKW